MNPVLTLEETGVKTNQLPIDTITDESDFKALKASGIGEGGVSVQITKPTKTTAITDRIPSNTLYLRLMHSHQSSATFETLLLDLEFAFLMA
jgi:hypothetical protein